jgi:hypothetical protein
MATKYEYKIQIIHEPSFEGFDYTYRADEPKTADELLQERRKRNEAIDLFDCLQFCDKRDLILHNPDLIQKLALEVGCIS